jgi:hypothetical protein
MGTFGLCHLGGWQPLPYYGKGKKWAPQWNWVYGLSTTSHLPLQVKDHFAANSLLESGVENQWWWKLICVGGFVYSFVSFKPCAQVFYHSSRFRHPMAIPTQKSDILEADFASTQVLGVVGKCSGWHSRCLAKSSKTCSGGTILVMVL